MASSRSDVSDDENEALLGTSNCADSSRLNRLHGLGLSAKVQASLPAGAASDSGNKMTKQASQLSSSSQDHALHHAVAETYVAEGPAHVPEPSPGRKVFAAQVMLTRPHTPASPA